MDHFVIKQYTVMWDQAKIESLALYICTEDVQGALWYISFSCSLRGALCPPIFYKTLLSTL